MSLAIDRTVYGVAPRVGIESGSTLLEQLIDVARTDPSATMQSSVKKLRKMLGRARESGLEGVRASAASAAVGELDLDYRADRCVKAIKLRLEAWLLLDAGEPARRASDHLALLFPKGLRFTRATFAVQDAEMRRMLTELEHPALTESLAELVGEPFISAFEKAAKAYSEMVEAMGRVVTSEVDQRTVVIGIQMAIVQHASRVLGELEDEDADSVERVRGLLAPIDDFRAGAGAGGGGVVEEDEGEEDEGDDARVRGAEA